jgi:hypothetical protein
MAGRNKGFLNLNRFKFGKMIQKEAGSKKFREHGDMAKRGARRAGK